MFLSRPLQLCKTLKIGDDVAAVSVSLFLNNFFPTTIDSYFNWIRLPIATGASVMFHPRGTKPDPSTAVYVSPGTYQQFYVEQKNLTRLPQPYGNCSDRQHTHLHEGSSLPYSRATCISLCRQRQYIDACGCLDVYEYFTDDELEMGNYTFCLNITQLLESSTNRVNDTLTERFWNVIYCLYDFVPNENICDCPIECFEIQYSSSSSSAVWPNIYNELAFYDRFLRNDGRYSKKFEVYEKIWNNRNDSEVGVETLEQLSKLNLIKGNFVKISIKMRQKNTEVVKYIPAITWDTMASNLGGSLNLWLGISVMTAVEIVELIYSLLKMTLGKNTLVSIQDVPGPKSSN